MNTHLKTAIYAALGSSVMLLLLINAANAQTLNANRFTGCHLDGSAGVTSMNTSASYFPYASVNDLGATGGIYGVGVGCDIQLENNVVFGVFGDYSWFNNVDSSIRIFGYPGRISYDNILFVGGRLGYVIQPNLMVYTLLGWTSMDSSTTFLGHKVNLGDFSGTTFGGGMETHLSDSLRLGMEYRYDSLDGKSKRNVAYEDDRLGLDPDNQSVRITLKYVFGTGGMTAPPPLK